MIAARGRPPTTAAAPPMALQLCTNKIPMAMPGRLAPGEAQVVGGGGGGFSAVLTCTPLRKRPSFPAGLGMRTTPLYCSKGTTSNEPVDPKVTTAPPSPDGGSRTKSTGKQAEASRIWTGRHPVLVAIKWLVYYALQGALALSVHAAAKKLEILAAFKSRLQDPDFMKKAYLLMAALGTSWLSVFLGSLVVLLFGRSPAIDMRAFAKKIRRDRSGGTAVSYDRKADARELMSKIAYSAWPCIVHASPSTGASLLVQKMAAEHWGVTYVSLDPFKVSSAPKLPEIDIMAQLCIIFGFGWMPRSWLATFLQVAGMIGRIVLGRPPVLVFDHLKNAKEEDLNNLLTLGEKLRDLVTVVLVCPSFQLPTLAQGDCEWTRLFVEPMPVEVVEEIVHAQFPSVPIADIHDIAVLNGGSIYHTTVMAQEKQSGRDPVAWYNQRLYEEFSLAGLFRADEWVLRLLKSSSEEMEQPTPVEQFHAIVRDKDGIKAVNRRHIFKRDASDRISFISPGALNYAKQLYSIIAAAIKKEKKESGNASAPSSNKAASSGKLDPIESALVSAPVTDSTSDTTSAPVVVPPVGDSPLKPVPITDITSAPVVPPVDESALISDIGDESIIKVEDSPGRK